MWEKASGIARCTAEESEKEKEKEKDRAPMVRR